jgi:hypothetical protein
VTVGDGLYAISLYLDRSRVVTTSLATLALAPLQSLSNETAGVASATQRSEAPDLRYQCRSPQEYVASCALPVYTQIAPARAGFVPAR